ncbi:MAG: DNA polymerase IV [Eubacterium sp.]
MERIIFHIDVNSAFLSWTAVKMIGSGADIDIREVPAIIGGDRSSRHGVVLAKSIPAQKYHIVTGEPIVSALKKCPDLLIYPPEHDFYQYMSKRFINILRNYTDCIEQVSIDECYMDFTGIKNNFESPLLAAEQIKNNIYNQLGFTVNIGISTNKILAKMASDFTKPDKIHTLYPEEIPVKMWPLPVSELLMVGKSSRNTLKKLGINTIGELAHTSVDVLESHLKKHGHIIWEYANGIDDSKVASEEESAKGIGNSVTTPRDLDAEDEINKVLLSLAEQVGGRLRMAGQKAGNISIEIKYADFSKISKQTMLDTPTGTSSEIYAVACRLFKEVWNGFPVRLLGIRTTKLADISEPEQIDIFELLNKENKTKPDRDKMKKLDEAMDKIRKKYGTEAVLRASLMERNKDE